MATPAAVIEASRVCGSHGAAAVGDCLRCGSFVCKDCRRWQAERTLCQSCRARLGDKPSSLATLALVFGTVGLLTLLPGIAAVIAGQRELGRIRRCEVSDAGEVHAKFARGLGILELVMIAIVSSVLFLRFS